MKLLLNPEVSCQLTLKGRTVEMSGATLHEALGDASGVSLKALPEGMLRQLFSQGLLLPEVLAHNQDLSHWREKLAASALSPYLDLSLNFPGLSNIEPALAMFLAPEFVQAAEAIYRLTNYVLNGLARSCAVRGVRLDPCQANRQLQKTLETWLATRPQYARWFAWQRNEAGELEIRVEDYAQVGQAAPVFEQVECVVTLNGQGSRRSLLPLDAVPALARVVDAISAGKPCRKSDLQLSFVRRVLAAIEAVGGFVPRREAAPVFPPPAGADEALVATHLGHAGLLIDGGGRRVVIDPWVLAWNDSFACQPPVPAQWGRIDAICYTHHHLDHLNQTALLMLPHDVPVLVPELTGSPLEPRLADFLRAVGFQDVRTMAHGATYQAGDLTIEAVPFYGEGADRLHFGANCYLLARGGRNILAHADAAPDSQGRSLVSTGQMRDLVARRGPVDVIFGTWWQEREFLCCLSPLAIFTPGVATQDWMENCENCDCPPAFISTLAQAAGATHFLTYAESGSKCFLKRELMGPYVPTISFLWQPLADIQEMLRADGVATAEAQPFLRAVLPVTGPAYLDWSGVEASRKCEK